MAHAARPGSEHLMRCSLLNGADLPLFVQRIFNIREFPEIYERSPIFSPKATHAHESTDTVLVYMYSGVRHTYYMHTHTPHIYIWFAVYPTVSYVCTRSV